MAGVTIPPEPPGADARLPLGTQLFRFVATGGVSAVVDLGLLMVGKIVQVWKLQDLRNHVSISLPIRKIPSA